MHLGQTLRQGETDAQTAFRLVDRLAHLSKHLEHARQHRRSDSNAIVLDRYGHARSVQLRRNGDISATPFRLAVFRRVMEKVRKDLSKSNGIAIDINFFRWKVDVQRMAISLDE